MGYNTTGLSHSNGLKGEKVVAEMLGTNTLLQSYLGGVSSVVKRGGTQYKEDIAFTRDPSSDFLGISVKNRSKKSGTFDWINSTALVNDIPGTQSLLAYHSQYSQAYAGTKKDENIKKKHYQALKDACSNVLDSMSPDDIRQVMQGVFSSYRKKQEFFVAVYYASEATTKWFEFNESHPIVPILDDQAATFFFKKGRGTASRQLWYEKDGQEHNTHLRFRLGLNNGASAWLAGKDWSSNATSVITVKIQQDNPDKVLESINELREFVV